MAWSSRTSSRVGLGTVLGCLVAAAACSDDGSADGGTDGADTVADTAGPPPPPPTSTTAGDDTDGCVAGSEGCGCLDDACVGGLFCVEGSCVQGPQIDVDEGRSVLGGLVVPVESEVMAEEFAWSQVSGPTVEILGEGMQISVVIPADAPPGEVVTLRLTATRNGVTLDADVELTILDAVFENFLSGISDPMQLGTTEGLAFGPTGMWVVSTEGFVSRFDPDGAFVERYEVPGSPIGANFSGENLVIANTDGTGRVEQLASVSGNLSLLFDTVEGGAPVGTVNFPLPDNGGNVYVSTRLDQTVLRWDAKLGTATVMLQDLGTNPNALAFGPEGNVIYVGTVGHVWRVPLVDGGGAGEPEDYLDLGDDTGITYEVDGLIFDEGANLWVGCPNASTLLVAHYSARGPTEVARSFANVGGGVSGFVGLRHGNGDFGNRTLYYTNLGDGTVGRLQTGLMRLDAPLAD